MLLYFNILGVLLCNGDTVVMLSSAVLQFIFISLVLDVVVPNLA
jgi:hypothetical protein